MHQLTGRAAMVVTVSLFLAACGGSSSDTSSDSSSSSAATSSTTPTTTPTTGSEPSTSSTSGGTETTAVDTDGSLVTPGTIDKTWPVYTDNFFVYGVASDDVLNVRLGPGVDQPIVAVLRPNQSGIRRFDATEWIGRSSWGAIEVPGGAGWVNLSFLRPEGSRPPRTEGTIDPRTETAADDVQALLGAGEYQAVSGFVDPDVGLVISIHAYVADDAIVLSPAQVAGAASDSTTMLWGVTDGEGADVISTIAKRFKAIAGDPGLTSTDVIAFDTRVGLGNSIDNIAERFPGSHVVEYHFEGTSLYGDFDWSSVRFVFDTEHLAPTGRPALLAIVQDTWTI